MFDLDRILATVKSNESNIDNIREHMKALHDVDLQCILMEKVKLTEEEALTLASFQAGVQGIVILKEALRHVPENITRNENGKSMRFIFVCKIFRALASNHGIASTLKDQQIELLCQFLELYCPDFVTSPGHQSIWSLTQDEGIYFNKFLTPPVTNCLGCDKLLTMHNRPSKATLFTLKGPVPCSKVILECRDCSARYGIAKFTRGNDLGSCFYPQESAIDVIEVSNVTYMGLELDGWIPSLSNHCWVSFSGFSEAYNDVNAENIQKFCEVTHGNLSVLPGKLSAKAVAKSFWYREVEKELQEIGLREKWEFADQKMGGLSGSNDHAMEYIDSNCCDSLYSHVCYANCKSKGCGNLFVADGNWKLRYAHCMWKVPIKLPEFGEINYPQICPLSPRCGHAFCEAHCKEATVQGYPTELRPFLKSCGISKEGIEQGKYDTKDLNTPIIMKAWVTVLTLPSTINIFSHIQR
ncbi:Hypothetical predicted protein [Paramuricea clavata]|uniref:Uncharacterized protein n=1 Tax=Paramuricea clavata TaxID=317549 RepID=A0A6S7I3Z7_PARCT|nr:Hypothetical predicted protein [Paramuricea clavata]